MIITKCMWHHILDPVRLRQTLGHDIESDESLVRRDTYGAQ